MKLSGKNMQKNRSIQMDAEKNGRLHNILIVDDDTGSCESLGDIFTEKGYHVETANTGQEAIKRAQGNVFEISLIDIKLPDISGIELLKKLKSLNPDLIFIMITGYASIQNAIQAMEEGANSFFIKPLVIEQLLNKIDETLNLLDVKRKYLQSQEHYRYLFEESPVINLVIGQDGLIKDTSKIVLGYRKEQLIAKQAKDFIVSKNRKKAFAFFSKNFKSEKTSELEIEVFASDGSIHTLLFSAGGVLIEVDQERSLLCTAIDITEKRYLQKFQELTTQILELLNRPEDKTNTIKNLLLLMKKSTGFEAIGIRLKEEDDFPYYETNGFPESFVESERYLCIRDSSGSAVCDSKGDPILECMCGNILRGRFDPSFPFFTRTGSFWTNSTSELLATTTETDRQTRTRNRCNGEGYESVALIPLHSDYRIIGLLQINDRRKGMFTLQIIQIFEGLGSSIGIALERKHTEDAMRESEAKLKEAQALGGMGNWEFDIASQKITWSDQTFRLYGRDPALGPPTVEEEAAYYSPEQSAMLHDYARQASEEGKDYQYVMEVNLPDGEKACFSAMMQAVKDDSGKVVKLFGTVQDITERKRAEEEIRRLNAELEQRVLERTAQLEAVNKDLESFCHTVSHDLRAPLRAIEGFSRIIDQDYSNLIDPEGKRLLGVIHINIQKMDRLITDLLELSRVGRNELQLSIVDMTALANAVYQEIASPEVRQKFVFSISSLPDSSGDPTLMRQVWSNLLSNAIKYTLPKEVRTIEVGSYTEGDMNIYYVKDNGVGFNPKYTHKLFGLFQRLHSVDEFEGTGVGLSIVQRIIQRHGGRVWAEGKVNEGATVYFVLPIIEVKPK
jgi:PAS domain S-box-containing protein